MFKQKFSQGLYAGIDCGTVSIRMLLIQVYADGTYKQVDSLHAGHSIGHDLHTHGALSLETIKSLIQTTKKFVAHATKAGAIGISGVVTESFRSAANGEEALKEISQEGVVYKILTGAQELEVSLLGAQHFLNDLGEQFYFVDSGGGSTEIALVESGSFKVLEGKSLRIGVSTMSRTIEPLGDKPSAEALEEFTEALCKTLKRKMANWAKPTGRFSLVMAGSTIHLKRFQLKYLYQDKTKCYGDVLSYEDVQKITRELAELGPEGRAASPYVDELGVHYFLPSALKTTALMRVLGVDEVRLAPSGVCTGLALQQAGK